MPLLFISESQSAFLPSTPIHASQDSFVNSPVDCRVPTTPSFAHLKYVSDQRVPLTPVAHVEHVSLTSPQSTPENNINSTPTINEAIMCFDDSNENFQNGVTSVDQLVPFMPEGNFIAASRQENCFGQSASSHFTVLHVNNGSCTVDPYSFENAVSLSVDASKYPKRFTKKRLSLTKYGNKFGGTTSTDQNCKDMWTSQTPVSNELGNKTLTIGISECSSQPSNSIYNALPERSVSSPISVNLPPQKGTEPLPSTLLSVSFISEASTSMVYLSAGVSSSHTRNELTQLRRPLSQIKQSHCCPIENPNSQKSEQLMLFHGDDIFV